MGCNKIQNLLTDYIDDELSAEQSSLISVHLEECTECRELLAMMTAIPQVFSELTEVEPPSSIRRNVMATIAQEAKPEVKHGWQWRRVAAAIVLFVMSLSTGLYPLIEMQLAADMALEQAESRAFGAETANQLRLDEPIFTSDETAKVAGSKAAEFNTESAEVEVVATNSTEDGTDQEPLLVRDNADAPVTYQLTSGLDDDVEEAHWLSSLPMERLLFAITGMIFSLLMFWYARPQKSETP